MTSPAAEEMINVRVAAVRLAQFLGSGIGAGQDGYPGPSHNRWVPSQRCVYHRCDSDDDGDWSHRYAVALADQKSSYWMFPNHKARTTMGRLMAMIEDTGKDMLGTGREGRLQDMASEVAWPSTRTARPTGGTRGFPMRRPRRYPPTAGPATAKFPTVTSISRVT